MADGDSRMDFMPEMFGCPFIRQRVGIGMENLGVKISENAVGGVNSALAEFLIKSVKVLSEDHMTNTGAASGRLKMMVVVRKKVLPLVSPKENGTFGRIICPGVAFKCGLE